MPNGKPGDHPITDMLIHGKHPFPPDVEDMIRQLHAINPQLLHSLGIEPFDWEAGKNLDEARAKLRQMLDEHGGGNA